MQTLIAAAGLGLHFLHISQGPVLHDAGYKSYVALVGVCSNGDKRVDICLFQLLEMEAMLSGAPDAFILVTKQWMNIKR